MNPTEPVCIQIRHDDPVMAMGLAAALRMDALNQVTVAGIDAEPESPARITIADHANALRLAAQTGRRSDVPPLVAVGTPDRERDIRQALEAGVAAILLAGFRLHELRDAVHALRSGTRYVCRTASQRLADSLVHEALTARETDVLHLLARGLGNKAIARELTISIGTVKTHVKAILDKLNACSRTQAADVASRRGLIDAAFTGSGRAAMSPHVS
jgi:DNA-binding NarL/FixJ family response regulator